MRRNTQQFVCKYTKEEGFCSSDNQQYIQNILTDKTSCNQQKKNDANS